MTDVLLEVRLKNVSGGWGGVMLEGRGLLRLHQDRFDVAATGSAIASEPYRALTGAAWRTGTLMIHTAAGAIAAQADEGLDRAWVTLTSLACPLPEFTRALRSLGSRRGGDTASQSRFFAPLMQARRRLQDETDLDRRLAVFGAAALGERMKQALEGLASEYHPKSAPDRRALEAGLSDAAEPLFARLAALREVESEFAAAGPERRFDAWRVWLTGVRAVFAEADRSWQVAARLLPEPRPRPRRWWRGGMPLVLVVSLGLLSGGWR